jgi:hypothetical protein
MWCSAPATMQRPRSRSIPGTRPGTRFSAFCAATTASDNGSPVKASTCMMIQGLGSIISSRLRFSVQHRLTMSVIRLNKTNAVSQEIAAQRRYWRSFCRINGSYYQDCAASGSLQKMAARVTSIGFKKVRSNFARWTRKPNPLLTPTSGALWMEKKSASILPWKHLLQSGWTKPFTRHLQLLKE